MKILFKNYAHLSAEDARTILRLRNEPDCRKHMFNNHVISEEEHFSFIHSLRNRKDCFYWAILVDGEVQGGINLQNISQTEAEPGIFLRDTDTGFGAALDFYTLDYYYFSLHLNKLIIHVNSENKRTLKMQEQKGFFSATQRVIVRGGSTYIEMQTTVVEWMKHRAKYERMAKLAFPIECVIWDT